VKVKGSQWFWSYSSTGEQSDSFLIGEGDLERGDRRQLVIVNILSCSSVVLCSEL
jgi:hypothetical protein